MNKKTLETPIMMRASSSISEPYQPIHHAVCYTINDIDSAHKISTLLQDLFSSKIEDVKISQHGNSNRQKKVTVYLAEEQYKKLRDDEELFIPKKLKFNIDAQGISFKKGYAPSEISTSCCGVLMNQLFWRTIRVHGNYFQFISSESRLRIQPASFIQDVLNAL